MTVLLKPDSAEQGPVYICHGAEGDFHHTLKIAGMADSIWFAGKISLNFATGETPEIITDPPIGELQTFDPQGVEWKLHCPAGGVDRAFECWVQSEYTATPPRVHMHLGHYRRIVLDARAPIKAPVAGDNVTAAVTVGSYYTEERLEGVDVEWSVNGDYIATIPTDVSGESAFSHTVRLQDSTIKATIQSPYDGPPQEKEFEMTVYEQSPWTEAILTVNGKQVKWNDPIVLLRGKGNELSVEVEPAIAKSLRLELVEHGGLIVAALPAFETWTDPVGEKFNWTITPESSKSGHIKLLLLSRDVDAPWELSCRVLSSDLADEVAKIQVNGNDIPLEGVLFFRNEPMTVTAVPMDGSPLAGGSLELKAIPLTGVSDANLTVTRRDDLTWAVNAHTLSGTFKFELVAADVPTGMSSPACKVMSRWLTEEVDKIKVDGVDMPATGITFFRNEPKTITITYKQHSPLQGHPLELAGVELSDGMPGNVDVASTGAHTWSVNAHTNSGTFNFELTGSDMTVAVKTPGCKVISRDLSAEVDKVQVEGINYPPAGIVLLRDVPQTVTVTYKQNSPLAGHPLTLTPTVAAGLQPSDVKVTTSGDHTWTLTASTRSGTFLLDLTGQEMRSGIKLPTSKVLSRNLADEAEVLIDGEPVPAEGTEFRKNISRLVTLRPKPSSPLSGYPIKLKRRLIEGLEPGDLVSAPNFDLEQSAHRWDVTGLASNGTFELSFEGARMTSALTAPVFRVLGSVSDYFTIQFDGKLLATGEEMLLTRYGLHKITFIPKVGAPARLRLNWGVTPPEGVEMLPAVDTSQAVDPIKGASWEIRCTGFDGKFSLIAASDDLPTLIEEFPVSVAAGSYKLTFIFLGLSMPYPPELTPALMGLKREPLVKVTTQEGVPVEGVQIQFIAPDFPDGYGTTGSSGGAFSSQSILYEALGVYEVIAKTMEPTGRVSMMRCLINRLDKP